MSAPAAELAREALRTAIRIGLHLLGVDACACAVDELLAEERSKLSPDVARVLEAPADALSIKKFGAP